MNLKIRMGIFLVSLVSFNAAHPAEQVWHGLLHAHTSFSDGSGPPEEAYATARPNGVDFFAVTPQAPEPPKTDAYKPGN